jgi:hypothetical protein
VTLLPQDKQKANITKKRSGRDVEIADAKRKIKELRFTIRVYTEHKMRGGAVAWQRFRNTQLAQHLTLYISFIDLVC